MTITTNNLRLRPVFDLLDYKFLIPSFQRGYRWTSFEVKDLLDDIYEFMVEHKRSEETVFYCLQPLIVYLKGDQYHLIDGQQRLTTIYIILTYLKQVAAILGKDKLYNLDYQTRPDSRDYLKNIDGDKAQDNVDYFHIYNAFTAVEDWFQNKDGTIKMEFVKTLTANNDVGRNVKFIWYEINEIDAIDVFTRINIGKIPLTNAELVKALFVREKNFIKNGLTKKIFLASEWDYIERKLSEPPFWYFMTNYDIDTEFDNKIEFLLDLISNKNSESEKLHTFHFFNKLIENEKLKSIETNTSFDVDVVWKVIKDKFQQLEEWFNNHIYYHLIGYLLTTETSLTDLFGMANGKSKEDFIYVLRKEIKKKLKNVKINELIFDTHSDKRNIRRILLLFNIESIIQSKKSYIKFPFDRFKNESWDIEHINSQSPFDNISFYKEWCVDILEYITGLKIELSKITNDSTDFENYKELMLSDISEESAIIILKVIDILNTLDPKPKVEELAELLYRRCRGEDIDETHSLSNLTLLDPLTNRGYGNALFPIKRNKIIRNDREGIFTPICTKNVFLKYYSNQFDDVLYWKKSDAKAYLDAINEMLFFYFN